ncbi:ABC transporter ATP-binding protein [Mycoplasmopsis lipofaciens]|uniref:ABC transporter ATP-binding protein n=1 Tax=Mycoplasmopsis lipofaciens TaxID=114884 RepID=UPI000488A68B|nr:ABC transporter ATP-binding protein [Mycoplasmopsis lipofaciens]
MFKLIKILPRNIKLMFLVGVFIVIISVLFNLVLPNIISQFIKLIFDDNQSNDVQLTFFNNRIVFAKTSHTIARNWLIIAVVINTFMNVFLTFISMIIIVIAADRASRYFRNKLFEKIQNLSLRNISDLKTESIITRVSNDVGIFWDFLVNGTTILVRGSFMAIGGCILAFLVDPVMSLAVLSIVPLIGIIITIVGIVTNPLLKKTQKSVELVTKIIDENVTGARVIKTYNLEENRKKVFNEANNNWYKIQYKTNMIFQIVHPLFFTLINILTIVIYSIAANKIIRGVATDETMVNLNIFIDYLFTISFGILFMVFFLVSMFRAKVSANRINEILDAKVDQLFVKKGFLVKNNFDLSVDQLYFKYYDSSPNYTLMNINLNLPYKKVLGIIGPTGSGKSTFVNLLLNNYVYKDGSIKIGGYEVNEINTLNLHKTIGIVYQDALLYSGTIKSNLLWAKEDATIDEINEALKNACAYDFVYSFEDGLDHKIVQGAKNLSGGQKQRLSIARALLRKPKILILDDSTSALDNITTRNVIDNIKNNYNCSLILISQKIGAIKIADNIMVMTNGSILAAGKHEELIRNCDFYQQIYNNQLEQ